MKREPKYQEGQLVLYKGKVKQVFSIIHKFSEICYYLTLPNGQSPIFIAESKIKPYTTNTKIMIESEYNEMSHCSCNCPDLCKILDNADLLCSLFYSPAFGEVSFEENRASEGEIEIETKTEGVIFVLDRYGRIANEDGECILFPSKNLYEKYPLNAKEAWNEWLKEQPCECRLRLSVERKGGGENFSK